MKTELKKLEEISAKGDSELRDELIASQTVVEKLRDQLAAESAKSRERLDNAKLVLEGKESKLQKLTAELNRLKGDYDHSKARLDNAEKSLKLAEDEKARLGEREQDIRRMLDAKEAELSDLRKQFNELQFRLMQQKEYEEKDHQYALVTTRCTELERLYNNAHTEKEELSFELNHIKEQMSSLNNNNSRMQGELKMLAAKEVEAIGKVSKLEQKILTLNADHKREQDNLETQLQEVTKRETDLKLQLKTAMGTLESLKRENDTALNTEVSEKRRKITHLESQLASATHELDMARDLGVQLQNQLQNLKVIALILYQIIFLVFYIGNCTESERSCGGIGKVTISKGLGYFQVESRSSTSVTSG
jgi:chromosome segregation ATPase